MALVFSGGSILDPKLQCQSNTSAPVLGCQDNELLRRDMILAMSYADKELQWRLRLTNVQLDDIRLIFESPFRGCAVVFKIIPQRLAEQIQAMQMVQALDISRVTASVFRADFYLIRLEPRFCCQCLRNQNGTVIHAQRLPGCINLWPRWSSEDVGFHEGPIELGEFVRKWDVFKNRYWEMLASAHYNTGDEQYCVIAVISTLPRSLVRDPHIVPTQKLNDVMTTIDTETRMKWRRGPSPSLE